MNSISSTINTASQQWASRPDDERFTSLVDLHTHLQNVRDHSRSVVVANRDITVVPAGSDHKGIGITGPNGHTYFPSNWAFGQLCGLAKAPAGYLRTLPSELVADCANYGLHVARDPESVGLLLYKNGGEPIVSAATGPDYGRIWSSDIVEGLVDRFGDGITGRFTVPGEFGQRVQVTKANTTLYASDRDCFVFLADETNRVTIPNRRDGSSGSLARGFYISNSEVGAGAFVCAMFLFDYACKNRIIWGVGEYREIRIRHTKGGPARYAEQILPIMREMADSPATSIAETVAAAQRAKLGEKVETFLATRFGKGSVAAIVAAHDQDEHRPIETVWDAVTGATAYARSIRHQDARVDVERTAGKLLDLVAA